jgi:hypothetical protein
MKSSAAMFLSFENDFSRRSAEVQKVFDSVFAIIVDESSTLVLAIEKDEKVVPCKFEKLRDQNSRSDRIRNALLHNSK